ncbi:MAG: hypothetical protein DCF25_04255 [Leptolyngbya foveolarum]|uniref:Uncharacterized protein n=1 Tax=Leptolyngbya foveolarum TaxID=47253 RepID=A0A2W4UP06_9CYAN|nr:MAG: hypothetical protein DCF25_04255 [Leptolyngbya foveolarum]
MASLRDVALCFFILVNGAGDRIADMGKYCLAKRLGNWISSPSVSFRNILLRPAFLRFTASWHN